MSKHRLGVLIALGQGPISVQRLSGEINVQKKQLERFILPPMACRTEDRKIPWVTTCSMGACITRAGIEQLDLRKISHLGEASMPRSVRNKFQE